MSLFGQYIKEREGKNIVEHEQGFATYIFLDTHCYIEDIYVVPEARKSGVASALADEVTKHAKVGGYTKLLGSVKPSANGSTGSLKALLAYGFRLLSAEKDAIFFEKDI